MIRTRQRMGQEARSVAIRRYSTQCLLAEHLGLYLRDSRETETAPNDRIESILP